MLTNGICSRVYHIIFAKPIDQELVVDIDFSVMNSRSVNDVELLYLWCKEGCRRSILDECHTQKQALSRFFIGAMLQTNAVLEVVRRELRRVSPDVRIDMEQIKNVLANEVIKREVMDGDKATEARKKISRSASKALGTANQRVDRKEAATMPEDE